MSTLSSAVVQIVVAIVTAMIASSGLWAWATKRSSKKDAKTKMLMGLGYDRIVQLGMYYIDRGYITKNEYEDLYKYLYQPYEEMGGNGSAQRIMDEVKKLPIRKEQYIP